MMKSVLQICGSLACLSITALFLSLTLQSRDLGRQASQTLAEVQRSVTTANSALTRIDRTMALYQSDLESDRSRKALQASLEVAAAWKATAKLVNVTVVPNINGTLIELRRTTARLGDTADAVNHLVETQNANIGRTMERVTRFVETTDGVVGGFGQQGARIGDESVRTLIEFQGMAADVRRIAAELQLSAAETTALLSQLRSASESAPGIAKDVERMTHSASRWQRPLSLVTLLIALFGALR